MISPEAARIESAREAVKQDLLPPQHHVAETRRPLLALGLLEAERHDQLELSLREEPLLVDDLAGHGRVAFRRNRRRDDHFVLDERLLGEERPRQVQVAARPGLPVRAERADVGQCELDLRLRQGFTEGRHQRVEPAGRPAFVDDRQPVAIGLADGEVAVREIRYGQREGCRALGHASAVRPVASLARRAVHSRRRAVVRRDRLLRGGRRQRRERERHGKRQRACQQGPAVLGHPAHGVGSSGASEAAGAGRG